MGLIAREVETRGIATVSLTSALSITQAVRPPRAAFVDFPLGHTAGKPGDPALQEAIVRAALECTELLDVPGATRYLPYRWTHTEDWKLEVMKTPEEGGVDTRVERHAEPQYQTAADRALAEEQPACPSCITVDVT